MANAARIRCIPDDRRSVENWFREWPPQLGARQWQNGKSAKELAKAWFTPGAARIPPGLDAVLDSDDTLRESEITSVRGEVAVPLNPERPSSRHTDLVLHLQTRNGPALVHVEAKSDEAFGETVSARVRTAIRQEGNDTTLPIRVTKLCKLMFPHSAITGDFDDLLVRVGHLRYQLLHATAATILDAARQQIIFLLSSRN